MRRNIWKTRFLMREKLLKRFCFLQAETEALSATNNLYFCNDLIPIGKVVHAWRGPDAAHPPGPNTPLLSITSLITAAIYAGSSIRTVPQQRAGSPIACNLTQGHETLTSDPACDTSGSIVPQVSGKRAKNIPNLHPSRAPAAH